VGRRILPALLAGLALVADSQGAHGLARDALLGAVPFAAVAALVAFGDYLEGHGQSATGLQAALSAASVVLLVFSCAARSSALHGAPAPAVSALVATLGLFALKGLLAAAPHMRRLSEIWPAKP
jgi:hypothetical protein